VPILIPALSAACSLPQVRYAATPLINSPPVRTRTWLITDYSPMRRRSHGTYAACTAAVVVACRPDAFRAEQGFDLRGPLERPF
jgi:hypothetical protein